MRVLYCVSQLAMRGGAERIVITKMNALVADYSIEVHVLIADQKGREYAYPLDPRLIVHDMQISNYSPSTIIPFVTFIQMCIKLRKLYTDTIMQIKPDVILVIERGFDDFVIPFICKQIPRIREFHSSMEAAKIRTNAIKSIFTRLKTKLLNKIVYTLFNKYDGIVLLTERDSNYVKYDTKTYIIPNFISQIPTEKSDLMHKNVISVGRLDVNKNFKDQILAWTEVQKQHPDWQLHIFGDGVERDNLESLVHNLNLDDVVHFHGNVPNIDDYYLKSSIMLFTSRAEGFGMVLVEASSYGIPCVSYDAPCGPSEIIQNGKNGFLIEVGDVKNLADKINYLIEHDDVRLNMGLAARQHSAFFTEKEVMPRWISLFNNLQKH